MAKKKARSYGPNTALIQGARDVAQSEALMSMAGGAAFAQTLTSGIQAGIEEQEKTRQQKLQEERENITSNFINSMPDEDQFFSGINEQENPKEWKKATDKYNKEYSSWHNKAVDANVDFDQVNDVLYPET